MIIAPAGLAARYKQQGKEPHWTRQRVVAFDDDWQPLVISDDHGAQVFTMLHVGLLTVGG